MAKRGRPPLPPGKRKPRLSGAQRRKAELDLLEQQTFSEADKHDAAVDEEPEPEAAQSTPSVPATDEAAAELVKAAYKKLGAPPSDPVRTIIWGNKLAAIIAWDWVVGSMSKEANLRRRGALDAVRSLGMTSSKAVDKDRLRKIEKRLGMAEEEDEDGLEERPSGKPPALRG